MVPQALGYAALAGVPVQAGLYAIPLALVAMPFSDRPLS
jgi:MFS superfamily sulfate permease-like transporter